jgi:hypothetical protein
MRKKMLAGIVAGVLMAGAGFGMLSGQAQAAEAAAQNGRPDKPPVMRGHQGGERHMKRMNPDEAAKRLNKTFGVSEAEVKAAFKEKRDFRDIGQAAMLAKVSGKSFSDVLAMKTKDKRWSEISKELGVKPEQIRAQMNALSAGRIAQRGNIDKEQALSLLNKGYRAMDVSVAAKLAKLSNKDIQTVLDMKKINNRWGDVAEQLGVDRAGLRPNMGKGQFPGHGPQGGPPDGGEMPDEK